MSADRRSSDADDAAADALPPYPAGLSPETQIRIDRDGHFWNEGQRLGHEALERAFASWVGVEAATGRYILRNSVNWCYVTVDDAPLVVRALAVGDDGELAITLSDGVTEPLDLGSLRLDVDDVPYCDVRPRSGTARLPARFGRTAAYALLERIVPDAEGVLELQVGARRVAVQRVIRGVARAATS